MCRLRGLFALNPMACFTKSSSETIVVSSAGAFWNDAKLNNRNAANKKQRKTPLKNALDPQPKHIYKNEQIDMAKLALKKK